MSGVFAYMVQIVFFWLYYADTYWPLDKVQVPFQWKSMDLFYFNQNFIFNEGLGVCL